VIAARHQHHVALAHDHGQLRSGGVRVHELDAERGLRHVDVEVRLLQHLRVLVRRPGGPVAGRRKGHAAQDPARLDVLADQDIERTLGRRRARLEVQAGILLHVGPGHELQRVGTLDRCRDLGQVAAWSTRHHLDVGVAGHVERVVGREREGPTARPHLGLAAQRHEAGLAPARVEAQRRILGIQSHAAVVQLQGGARRGAEGERTALAPVRAPHHAALQRQVRAHDIPPGIERLIAAPPARAASAAGPRTRRGSGPRPRRP
jgi:hypothetical protein